MGKQRIRQRVDEFLYKNQDHVKFTSTDMDEIYRIGSTFNIIKYAFYFGYMRGVNDKKGGLTQ